MTRGAQLGFSKSWSTTTGSTAGWSSHETVPHPGPEKIVETYYEGTLLPFLKVTLDYQYIANPAYNRDRGPVSVVAVRVHIEH